MQVVPVLKALLIERTNAKKEPHPLSCWFLDTYSYTYIQKKEETGLLFIFSSVLIIQYIKKFI